MTTPLWKRIIARILEALLAIIFISPLVWVIICSFSPQAGSAQSKGWGVANYLTLFGYQEGLPKYLFNSVIVTLVAVVFSVVVCTLAGYSFSRFDYPGRNLGFMVTLSILMVPYASLLIPLMVWYKQIGLNDSLLGVGLGKGRQKFLYLPEEHNDCIFAVICEELGLVGACVIMLVFALLILRGFWIALHARDRFGALLVVGFMTLTGLQTFLNIAVVTGLVPATGISLPFFSYGGTALLCQLAEMGIVLSVSRQMPAPENG